jgi:hypothetical protein
MLGNFDLGALFKKRLVTRLEEETRTILRKYATRSPSLMVRIFVSEDLLETGVDGTAWVKETADHLTRWGTAWASDNEVKWPHPRVEVVLLDTATDRLVAQPIEEPSRPQAMSPGFDRAGSAVSKPGSSYEAVLEFAQGNRPAIRVRSEVTLGRPGQPGVVALDDARVSRRHTHLRIHQDALLIRDLDSRNGTRVNGTALAPGEERPLRAGDIIEIGDTRIHLKGLVRL